MESRKRDLARVTRCDFQIEDHGMPYLDFNVEYTEENGGQGLGRIATIGYLMKVMQVFNVENLRSCVGKSCWVTHDWDHIYKIEPLHKKDGEPFDLESWSKDGAYCKTCEQWKQNK